MALARQHPLVFDSLKVIVDVTYMPTLLTRANFDDEVVDPSGSNSARTDGGDITPYANDNQTGEMARAVIAFEHDSVTAADDADIEVWLSETSFVNSSVSDTTIHIAYKDAAKTQPAADSTFGSEAVFGKAEFVVLMEDTVPIDQTGNHTLSLAGGLTSIDGPFGKANEFAANDRLSNTDAALVDILETHDTTLSIISRKTAYEATKCVVSWDGTDDTVIYPMDTSSGNGIRIFWRDLGGSNFLINNAESLANTWIWTDFVTRASNDHEVFTNKVSADTSTATGTAGPFSTFFIGGFGPTQQDWDADVAQVFVWKNARSNGWVETQYNNQFAPGTFAAPGTPEDIGGAVGSLLLMQRSFRQ